MTNEAAMGYAIMAAKVMKLGQFQVDLLENIMRRLLDEKTEVEAEKAYREN